VPHGPEGGMDTGCRARPYVGANIGWVVWNARMGCVVGSRDARPCGRDCAALMAGYGRVISMKRAECKARGTGEYTVVRNVPSSASASASSDNKLLRRACRGANMAMAGVTLFARTHALHCTVDDETSRRR
jgi:hypothetical protein